MKTWIIAVPLGIALSAAGAFAAFAQAGSTGGTLGNTDKSISGDREEHRHSEERSEEPPQQRHIPRPVPFPPKDTAAGARDSSCKDIVGTWKWYLGVIEVTFLANGSGHTTVGDVGTWKCNGTSVSATWSNGTIHDRYSLSRDGNSLFATSSWGGGVSFTASRVGQQ
jgi:hypothetical protein